jgi:hypothetical protein
MRRIVRAVAAVAAVGLAVPGAARAADQGIPVKIAIVKAGKLAKFVSKPPANYVPSADGADDPTDVGASLEVFDVGGAGGSNTYGLPAGGWSGLGNPAGSKGYKYKGAGAGADPCKVVLIKEKVIKAVCKGTAVTVDGPLSGNLGIILESGTLRLCGDVDPATKNQAGLVKGKDAGAPGSCPGASTTTTSSTSTSTSTTTSTTGCCGAEQIVLVSTPGTLAVSTLPAFPFPSGVLTTINAGPPDANCKHDVIVPTGGFSVPTFCIPALGFTSDVLYTGCTGGTADGRGTLWDGAAPASLPDCPDSDIAKTGDTSAPPCGTIGLGCNTSAGGAGFDNVGDVDTTRGDGACNGPSAVHVMLDLPGLSITWNDGDGFCPDADGIYDPNTDTLVTQFSFILSPTTGTATGVFADKNGDACAKAGNGPTGPVTASGTPAPGPCCQVGQTNTVAAVGIAFSGGAPLYDLIFRSIIPAGVQACNPWPGAGSCVIDTMGGCLD